MNIANISFKFKANSKSSFNKIIYENIYSIFNQFFSSSDFTNGNHMTHFFHLQNERHPFNESYTLDNTYIRVYSRTEV